MKYYSVAFPNFTKLIIRTDKSLYQVFEILARSRGIEGNGGTIYHLTNFESLHEVSNPDTQDVIRSIHLNRIIE